MRTRVKMRWLLLCVCFSLVRPPSASAQCIDESPMPPLVPATTWTAWYSVDDPSDGADDESLLAVRAAYPDVCATPTQADCRVRFLNTDYATAGQTLASGGCDPAGGLWCRDVDQAGPARCLDYEVRFLCPTPIDALPEPHFHWDMSTKASVAADEPVTCEGAVSSIYPNAGGLTGTVGGALTATDSFDSSDHLCAVRNQKAGWVEYGSANDRCISEPACCTSGLTVTFWMRNRTPVSMGYISIILSTGGHASKARGIVLYLSDYMTFDLRGFPLAAQAYKLNVMGYYPSGQWTHHSFTFEPAVGTKFYMNGTFIDSTSQTVTEGTGTSQFDDVVMFSRNNNPSGWPYDEIDGDFSNFKVFYKDFNDTEVQNAYLQETTESKVLVHFLRRHSHEDSFGVELECLAKAGSPPAIVWHRSVDGARFESVSPSVDVAIYETSPTSYRRRSVLVVRHLALSSDVVFACEAVDTVRGGSVSKIITIPKRVMFWTPWLSADSPVDGDDRETLVQHRQSYDVLCKYPSDIQCRTVYGGLPSNETGQILNINCTLSSGLECLGADQGAEHGNSCFDYEVRYQCPEPFYRWTPWYDASDPDGTAEDETFETHVLQAYPDLCTLPIGAECRLKVGQQDPIASGVVPEVPYLCNARGFRCRHADNAGSCPDVEVRYRCPDATAMQSISVDSLQQVSHHLDPDLTLTCSATIGHPSSGALALEWAWLGASRPYGPAAAIASGGIVGIDSADSPSAMTIDNFASSAYANTTLVCAARDGAFVAAKTIQITPPLFCEQPLGVSSSKVSAVQITPSTVKSSPFKVPGMNGVDPWVPAVSDVTQTLDFDFGVDFSITGVAVQGDPNSSPPVNHLQSFRLLQRDNEVDSWVLYTDDLAVNDFTTDYSNGPTSFTTLTPNVTTRFLRLQPTTWTGEIMVRVELYACAVGESSLRILQLTKSYDVIANNFTFTCRAEHYPLPDITWLADGVPVTPLEGALEVSPTSSRAFPSAASSLTVVDFHPDNDSVAFTCLAQAGNEVEMANISTEYSFQGLVSVVRDLIVYYGSDVVVTCTASGDEIYVIEWGHRAASTGDPYVTVQSGGRFLIATVADNATSWRSTLTVSQFIQSDEAEYACSVNSDTARDSAVVTGRSGLWESWSNATYDEATNAYLLECAVAYPSNEPDVTWFPPSGGGAVLANSKYQLQNRIGVSAGNLTKVASLTVRRYSFSQDDGAYRCSFRSAVQELNLTVEAQYAYTGSVWASVAKPTGGAGQQTVILTCLADDDDDDDVYHAEWLRVVAGGDRARVDDDAAHSVREERGAGQFRLTLDIDPYSRLEDGDYVCSVNNGTGEATVYLGFSLGVSPLSPHVHYVASGSLNTAPPRGHLKIESIHRMSGHGHSHGGCSGGHDHDHDPPDRGTEFSLYTKIDTERVECLNEVTDGSGKLVFKPWDERLDIEKYVESDDDEELLFNIPFTGNVKLKGVIVIGGNEESHPAEMRLYKNRPNLTFDETRSDPDQVFEMQRDTSGILEYNTKIARFSNVNHLSIHFSKNFGAETSIVYYIGLRGEYTEAHRQGIMIAQYEAYANPKDHKTSLFDNVQHEIS